MSTEGSKIIPGQAEPSGPGDDCGCCEGTSVETPRRIFNRAGLPAIDYRVGTHSRFKETMLARLSSARFPALKDLRTRDDDDFSIALLDAWATACEVLTFYQERIANEAFLRTAGEHRSVLELAQLLGYRPSAGVAASTYLAFRLEEAPGNPEQALRKTTIPRGTRVNSVPGPGETQQTFETVEDFEARLDWNAIRPKMTSPPRLETNSRSAYLSGTDTRLNKGDAILFVGKGHDVDDVASDDWDLRIVTKVEPNAAAGHTYVEWVSDTESESLGSARNTENPDIYALRLRASLFGHNAMDPKLLHRKIFTQFNKDSFDLKKNDSSPQSAHAGEQAAQSNDSSGSPSEKWGSRETPYEWKFLIENGTLCLDSDYPGLLKGSWLVLSKPLINTSGNSSIGSYQRLFEVENLSSRTISKYGLSAKSTCVALRGASGQVSGFQQSAYRKTSVFAGSEKLALTDSPLTEPIWKDKIYLNSVVEDLEPGRLVFVRGKQAGVRVVKPILFYDIDPSAENRSLKQGEELTVLTAPIEITNRVDRIHLFFMKTMKMRRWKLRDKNGFEGFVAENTNPFEYIGAAKNDETVFEAALIKSVELVREDGVYSLLTLEAPLEAAFDRGSCEIHANIAKATHGETVSNILGNGDASQAFQRFALQQQPLTHVSAPTASGAESTLEVRVGDVLWNEVPTLLGRGPQERVYSTRIDNEGKVLVEFGDGRTGARLPTGQNNVQARYRKGIGLDGNVGAGQLSLLMDRPLGVQEVKNPWAATGAEDPESATDTRQSAPLGVLTLERAVSLKDYEDFARAFRGVAKALATWSWDGASKHVFITIAGPNGNAIPESSETHGNLVAALQAKGDPFVSFTIASYRPAFFELKLSITVSPEYVPETIRANVAAALRSAFGFSARSLGQPVHGSEVIEVVHGVTGVVAVELLAFRRTSPPRNFFSLYARLPASRPSLAASGQLDAAELLLLDPGPLEERLEVH